MKALPGSRDKLLFTPGPLTTSWSVKQAMLHDAGSWHSDFNAIVADLRRRLLDVAGVDSASGWEAIPVQGSGTFGVEAVFASAVPRNGKVAVLSNGAYGERMLAMLTRSGIDHSVIRTAEDVPADPEALDQLLARDSAITHVAAVHCETTTGILNPIEALGDVVRRHERDFIVDAMSSFAGIPIDLHASGASFLVSSANKCLEGVPGFAFVICELERLVLCDGAARSLSLDLLDQWRGFEKNGQFRYTPPTHSILACLQALNELDLEGGVPARAARYARNHQVLLDGMAGLGLRPFLPPAVQSHIITSFHYPKDPKFVWTEFYRRVAERGFLIYPGKLTRADTFRIGSIGRLFENDMRDLVHAIGDVLTDMGIQTPVAS